MVRDNRQAALTQLLAIATANGFATFDDIMKCADDNSLSIGEFDWLADAAGSRNVIIYDEAPSRSKLEDDEWEQLLNAMGLQLNKEAQEAASEIKQPAEENKEQEEPQIEIGAASVAITELEGQGLKTGEAAETVKKAMELDYKLSVDKNSENNMRVVTNEGDTVKLSHLKEVIEVDEMKKQANLEQAE